MDLDTNACNSRNVYWKSEVKRIESLATEFECELNEYVNFFSTTAYIEDLVG